MPTTLTGSANYSVNSTTGNEENTILIRGDDPSALRQNLLRSRHLTRARSVQRDGQQKHGRLQRFDVVPLRWHRDQGTRSELGLGLAARSTTRPCRQRIDASPGLLCSPIT